MSPQYQMAMWKATTTTNRLGPKILARIPLTPEEGTQLLNANWDMYLFALADGDITVAADTAEFVALVEEYLKLLKYNVQFSVKDKYCVTAQRKEN